MHIVIKTFTSGKRQQQKQQCRFLPTSLLFLGMLGMLAQSVASDDFEGTKTWNLTSLDQLRLQLFTNYNKNSQPITHGEPTNISVSLSVNYIDIDEMAGKVTMHSWLRIRWVDDYRSWNKNDYDNISTMHLKPKEVWKPDITLFNSAGEGGNYVGDTQLLLYYDGSFLWVPPVVYTAYCNLNFLMWPYDTQTCKVHVGSWTIATIDPNFNESNLDYDELVQSTEWEIVEGKSKYIKKDYYNYMEFSFKLQRRSSMYTAVIFTPASCIILLALSTFWLPPQMGEKILLNGIVIVIIAAFLMYFAQLLPILAENTPLIADNTNGTKTWNLTSLDQLHLQLFTNYDKNSQPIHRGVPTNISMGMGVHYIDIDEMAGKVTMHSWLRIRWVDDYRSWNKNDFGNISIVHLNPKEVWKPDITLFNSAGEGGDYIGDTQMLLYYDGRFMWVPPVVYTAYCNLSFLMWPFDTQTCKVLIGSWTLATIDPTSELNYLEYDEVVESTEWELIDGQSKFTKKDYYNYVEFSFKLRRRSSMYTAVIFTPASCIILLALSAFWLPPQMGEKLLLNGIVIVIITAFLMYFAQVLPILTENTPLIVFFYSSSMLLLSISTIITVVVLYLSKVKHKRRLPDFLKLLLNGPLRNFLLLTQFTLEAEPQSLLNNDTKEFGEHVNDNLDNNLSDRINKNPSFAPSNRSDWVLLATAVDRICFLCYCLIFTILAIVYSL